MRRAALALILAAWLIGAAPAAAADAPVVDAGTLRAAVAPDPWRLTFTYPSGRVALREVSDSTTGPTGTLGFASNGVWFHATRVVDGRRDGRAYAATVATNDPLGRRLAVRLSPAGEGGIRLAATVTGGGATSTGVAFDAAPGERYLGFGERSNAVDQRGGTVESYVAEGPYQPAERAFIGAFVPPPGYHPRDDATYFPMPWLLSTRGYGALVENDDTSQFRLTSDRGDAWSAEVEGGHLSLLVFAGPRPADALRRLTEHLGRQPPAAAPFYFGPWFQPKGDDAANLASLRHADAPASVVQTYTHYLPCGSQKGREAAERQRTAAFHAAGLAVTTYFNPMICTSYQPRYDEAVAAGALTRNALGQPYAYRYTGASQFFVGQFDFSAPAAVDLYGRLLDEAVQNGYDGWMEDFGEYTPTDAVSADGTPGPAMHNRYPVLYHGAAYAYSRRAPRPLARFNRSGWTGAARVSQIVWGGDPTTDWGFDGLASAVRNGLTMGLSGVSLWGSDIGGYFTLLAPQLTPELLDRWIEVGFASGIMRTEADGFALSSGSPRPQIFDPGVLPVWRRYAKLRTQLYPYLAGAESDYDRSGLPLMRHLALAYPDDPAATARDDEYLFGPHLLVAPVLAPGATSRRLYLPAGRWIDIWRSAALLGDGSLFLGRPRILDGSREATLAAPVAELPLLARAGAVIPLLPPDVQTLADYGSSRAAVHLRDRAGELRVLAFPRGNTRVRVGANELLRSRERSDGWQLEIRGARARTYRVQAALADLRRPFRPCRLELGGHRLRDGAWSYDQRTTVLRATVRTRSANLLALPCGQARP